MEKAEEGVRRACGEEKMRPALPAEPDGQHAAVESRVGLLQAAVGHVKVPVLKDQSLLRLEVVSNAHPTLGQELRVAGDFHRVLVKGCVEGPGAHVNKRRRSPVRLQAQAQQQGSSHSTPACFDAHKSKWGSGVRQCEG
jgi:hypothetical protein